MFGISPDSGNCLLFGDPSESWNSSELEATDGAGLLSRVSLGKLMKGAVVAGIGATSKI